MQIQQMSVTLCCYYGNFALAFSCNSYYFLESICYPNSWKFYDDSSYRSSQEKIRL